MVGEFSAKAVHHTIYFASFVIAINMYKITLNWVKTGLVNDYVTNTYAQIGITYLILYIIALYALPRVLAAIARTVMYK